MKLADLLSEIEYTAKSVPDIEISDIVYDSRKAGEGKMFVCLSGAYSDGHKFADKAYELGCRVFTVEKEVALPGDAIIIKVTDTRYSLAKLSAALFGHPERSLTVIGITGTKGKTTTASLAADILNAGGINTGYIGTTGIVINGVRTPTVNTTPESYELHKTFRKMLDCGVSAVVMEVSSQAVYMKRITGINYHIGVFTNLSPDHIGGVEHPTFEHYMACKAQLFKQCRYGIFNSDDEHYAEITENASCEKITFGMNGHCDYSGESTGKWKHGNAFGEKFNVKYKNGEFEAKLRMPGKFNIYNATAAIAIAKLMGISDSTVQTALANASVRGRFEIPDAIDDVTLIIDYAHNKASMEAALKTIREFSPERLITVFGSVGGRSEMRRAELGEVAAKYADFCIITSDNPDFEPPENIIADIAAEVEKYGCPYKTFIDRREAVQYAISNAKAGDVILFAGKGHEDYQIVNGKHEYYDEREEILKAAKQYFPEKVVKE